MGTFKRIAPNLLISDNPSFGDYNPHIVYDLLKSVDENFSSCLKLQPFSSCNCYLDHKSNGPLCCNFLSDHIIFLSATENYWCQWIYQFAHEYCHHLIKGELSGEISGLMWFEETICELSSIYHLYLLFMQWDNNSNFVKDYYAPSLRDYLNNLLIKNNQLSYSTNHPGWLQSWIPLLSEPYYHRDYYNAIAVKMFPLFVKSPHLWKIILHFGDMRKWDSLSELLEHLHQTSDDSYSEPLSDLEKLLLS